MPSADDGFDSEVEVERALELSGKLLAMRGVFGLIWLDDDLVVRRRYGTIVDFVEVGVPLVNSVLPVIGLEDDIKGLKGIKDGALRLPNVATVTEEGPGRRLNMMFYAFDLSEPYLMVVAPNAASSSVEVELSRQVRARFMAEAEAAAASKELARVNADLRVLNSNLEQFAAIVTHDLKAPMRAVRYLVDEIEAALSIRDTTVAGDKLQELRRQATRLSSMLSALLNYSSVGLSQEAIEKVDTRELVTEIVRSLPHQGTNVEISGTWPTLYTLVAPMDLTLRNLIENTLKHHDRDTGKLQLACADDGSAIEITVEDDGPGIAPKHHASVFLPFRAIGNGGEGMGLAIVQKMLDAVGGTITLASNPAERRGTTFRIRWPKKIAL
jgi:signal transduction histidine kinase